MKLGAPQFLLLKTRTGTRGFNSIVLKVCNFQSYKKKNQQEVVKMQQYVAWLLKKIFHFFRECAAFEDNCDICALEL